MGSCLSRESEFSVQQSSSEKTQSTVNETADICERRELIRTEKHNNAEPIKEEHENAIDNASIHLTILDNSIIHKYSDEMANIIIAKAKSESRGQQS